MILYLTEITGWTYTDILNLGMEEALDYLVVAKECGLLLPKAK